MSGQRTDPELLPRLVELGFIIKNEKNESAAVDGQSKVPSLFRIADHRKCHAAATPKMFNDTHGQRRFQAMGL